MLERGSVALLSAVSISVKKHLFCWKRVRTKLFVNKAVKGEIHLPEAKNSTK